MTLLEAPIPEVACPACGHPINYGLAMGQRPRPQGGDLGLCCYCASPVVIGADFGLAVADIETLRKYANSNPEKFVSFLKYWRRLIESLPGEADE